MTNVFSLGEVAEVFNGKTPSKSQQRDSGHPVLKIKDVDEHGVYRGFFESFVDTELAAKYRSKWILAGDSLILNAAHNADYVASKLFFARSSVEGVLPTGEWLVVRAKRDQLLPEFINYWLRSPAAKKAIKYLVKGIHLYPKDVSTLQVPVPSLQEQNRIVDILSRADGITRLRREADFVSASLTQAIFLDFFGDPASNPKRWPKRRLSDFISRFEGGKNLQAGDEGGSDCRILKVSAVTSGTYLESESKPTPNKYVAPPNHIVRAGDMLFSRANTVELVGATAIVETTNGKTLLPDKLWRIIWAEDVEQRYMLALFQSKHIRQELGRLSSGSSASMRNISQAKLFALEVPIAPITAQRQFSQIAEQVRSINLQQRDALAKANATLTSLLSTHFSTPPRSSG